MGKANRHPVRLVYNPDIQQYTINHYPVTFDWAGEDCLPDPTVVLNPPVKPTEIIANIGNSILIFRGVQDGTNRLTQIHLRLDDGSYSTDMVETLILHLDQPLCHYLDW